MTRAADADASEPARVVPPLRAMQHRMKLAVAMLVVAALASSALARSDAFVVSYYSSPGRVQSFDDAGALVATSTGGSGAQYVGAAIDSAGNWVTTRRSPDAIEIFSPSGTFISGFLTPELDGHASDVSLFADGTFAICNLAGSGGAYLYSPAGTYLTTFPTGPNAWGCTVDGLDRLWVVELTGNPSPPSTIYCFDRAGTLLTSFVTPFRASDVDVANNGDLWLCDSAGRLVRMSNSGTELSSFATGLGSSNYGLASMNDGTLWTVGLTVPELRHYTATGTLLGSAPLVSTAAVFIATGESCGIVGSYCTAGTSANGCTAQISATGNPSVSNASSFDIAVQDVEGQKQGILFYGLSGPLAQTWGGGSSSFLCVKPPTQRTSTLNSGGLFGMCDGAFALDFNAWLAAHPSAMGQPLSTGQSVHIQAWYRDPGSPKTTSLSNALHFRLCP